MKIYLRVIIEGAEKLVAACDEDLIGEYFEEDNRVLDVKEGFYKGEKVDIEELFAALKEYFILQP